MNHRSISDPPIARCLALDVSDTEIVATTQFAGAAQGHDQAETIFRLYRDGFMRGWSMGFLVDAVGTQRFDARQTGRTILEWTLLEYSAVGIFKGPQFP